MRTENEKINNSQLLIVIPAIKKNAVIPDQLIKKLNGLTLIQRAIDTAKKLTDKILIVTDSEEISLIAERNQVEFYKKSSLKLSSEDIIKKINTIVQDKEEEHIFIYRANTPLISSDNLKEAYMEFLKDESVILTSVKNLDKKIYEYNRTLKKINGQFYKELKAFYIYNKTLIYQSLKPYIIESEKSIEIETYQDWWICEKVLQRKRILFQVIGDVKIGMGHIYRALSLAHEITDHEILFVCDEKYKIAVDKIASMDYKVISTNDVVKTILGLQPYMVINDMLDTSKEYILELKQHNIITVNFEDLGEGGKFADLVINELYDEVLISLKHYRWGFEFVTLRDEFLNATAHSFVEKIDSLLITFGGTDQNNLTLLTLRLIIDEAEKNSIKIYIVCGSGYLYKQELEEFLNNHSYKNIELTYQVGVMSRIMEKTPIAFSSNGRTVYELADMNIISIVLSHHKREDTHKFASLEKGFINLGVFEQGTSEKKILESFQKLIYDSDYRKLLYLNITRYSFRYNKRKVLNEILQLMKENE